MSSLANHETLEYVKGIILGYPGSGKTGGLASLVKSGYKLRVYDFDNLLHTLVQYVNRDCPDLIGNVHVQTFTDKLKGLDQPVTMIGNAMKVMPMNDGVPTAFVQGLKQLSYWKTPDEDLGDPGTWGKETVVVIDSLTTMSNAAFRYVRAMNLAGREPQADYFSAQQLIVNAINLLCSKQMATNVLVLAHITEERDAQGSLVKGWPRSCGSALNSQLGGYFNTVLMIDKRGGGASLRRFIKTNSTGIIDLKNPAPFKVDDEYPLETGLASFFEAATGNKGANHA